MNGVRTAAPLALRAGASAIDTALVVAAFAVAASVVWVLVPALTSAVVPLPTAGLVLGVVGLACLVVTAALQGGAGSIGMRALGLRLAHRGDDQELGFGRALGRLLLWGLGAAILVGAFSPLFDRTPWRRGWHDRATGAVVVADPAREDGRMEEARAQAQTRVVRSAPEPTLISPLAAPPRPPLPDPAEPLPVSPTRAVDVVAAPLTAAARVESWAPAPGIPLPGQAALITSVPGVVRTPASPAARPAGGAVLAPAPADPAPALALLTWDDGARQAVYARTLFGRNPAGEQGALVCAVRDETLSLSKTHFEIGRDDRGTWFVDRHSTNGAVIVRGGHRARLVPGERVLLHAGDLLELGDRRITVEAVR